MKSKLFITGMVLFITAIYSCDSGRSSKKSIAFGDNLKTSISEFEESRQEFGQNVNESISNTTEELNNNPEEIGEVAVDWEKRWKKIHTQFNDLENDFVELGNESVKFFEGLNEISSGIEDETLRENEMEKNRILEERWNSAYIEASKNFEKIRKVIQDGDDYHRVLVASSIRMKIHENINELAQISEKAKSILVELKKFTDEGKKIIG